MMHKNPMYIWWTLRSQMWLTINLLTGTLGTNRLKFSDCKCGLSIRRTYGLASCFMNPNTFESVLYNRSKLACDNNS